MGKKVVTIDEMIDLAIGTPESAVNFMMLHKVLKLIARYCCKMNFKIEIDMDNMKADINTIGNDSRSSTSSSSESRRSFGSAADSGQSEKGNDHDRSIGEETGSKKEKDSEDEDEEKDENSRVEEPKKSESGNVKESKKVEKEKKEDGVKSEKTEDSIKKEKKNKKDGHKKKDDSRKKSSEKHKKRSSEKKDSESSKSGKGESSKWRDSDSTKSRKKNNLEIENRTNELENHFKELADRVETITQTIASHLDDKHLTEINGEIDKLKKNVETTTDQCFEVSNTINDQSSQIQEILSTINNIQLRKVENEELIDLLSGKADHSFVNEKVSTDQFEEIIQELRDAMNESTIQMDAVRLEANTSLEELKQELNTKLLAEEFDTAKTKIYKEIIKLTEQHELILLQQSEHVSAGAKMRNLSCFACNNDVVMLLEEETIPKFRGLKASIPAVEPLVGSKINVGKSAPEWKNHQLKAKDFTRTSKASRYTSNVMYEKPAYVKGKNGCMYKGNVGCDCVEGMNELARTKNKRCCDGASCCDGGCCNTVEAKNIKNISHTSKVKSTSKIIENTDIGDVAKISSTKVTNANNSNINLAENYVNTEDSNDVGSTPNVAPTEDIKIEAPEEPTISNNQLDGNTTINSANVPDEANVLPEESVVIVETEIEVEDSIVITETEHEPDLTVTNDQENNISDVPAEGNDGEQ